MKKGVTFYIQQRFAWSFKTKDEMKLNFEREMGFFSFTMLPFQCKIPETYYFLFV